MLTESLQTEDALWKHRTEKLVNHGLETFFPEKIAVEIACENGHTCSRDMLTFKGFFHRWYAVITQLVPSTAQAVMPVLKTSAAAAVKQCTGGAFGRQCGFKWASGVYDGKTGACQQMSVLGALTSIGAVHSTPVTGKTGGTSNNAGSRGDDIRERMYKPVTTADRAGAGLLTVVLVALSCLLFGWMCLE